MSTRPGKRDFVTFVPIVLLILAVPSVFPDSATINHDWRDGGDMDFFVPNNDVSMNKEVLVAEGTGGYTRFRVFYEMENLSAKTQNLTVGFPIKTNVLPPDPDSKPTPASREGDYLVFDRQTEAFLAFLCALTVVPTENNGSIASIACR
jgi:hypothetical protein